MAPIMAASSTNETSSNGKDVAVEESRWRSLAARRCGDVRAVRRQLSEVSSDDGEHDGRGDRQTAAAKTLWRLKKKPQLGALLHLGQHDGEEHDDRDGAHVDEDLDDGQQRRR